jgi:hypothetical protein
MVVMTTRIVSVTERRPRIVSGSVVVGVVRRRVLLADLTSLRVGVGHRCLPSEEVVVVVRA